MVLAENSVDPDPFLQFEQWYKERLSEDISIPNYMSLGTSSEDGQISVRTVLLKEYNRCGFIFYSNYLSSKGLQLESNPKAALLFYWPESARQIRIEGIVSKISTEESDIYFNSRPEENRLSVWASEQSSPIPDRQFLETRYEFFKNLFNNRFIERPPNWGGYLLAPSWFEFWQERKSRLHDRIVYSLENDKWKISRLAP